MTFDDFIIALKNILDNADNSDNADSANPDSSGTFEGYLADSGFTPIDKED